MRKIISKSKGWLAITKQSSGGKNTLLRIRFSDEQASTTIIRCLNGPEQTPDYITEDILDGIRYIEKQTQTQLFPAEIEWCDDPSTLRMLAGILASSQAYLLGNFDENEFDKNYLLIDQDRYSRPMEIYVDTSVIGGCYDEAFEDESLALINMTHQGLFRFLISDIILNELELAPENVQEIITGFSENQIRRVLANEETITLRDSYISEGIVTQKSLLDAHHVAIATVYRADMIVSWNYKHIVHFDKIRGFNAVNMKQGYPQIEIYSPKEVV